MRLLCRLIGHYSMQGESALYYRLPDVDPSWRWTRGVLDPAPMVCVRKGCGKVTNGPFSLKYDGRGTRPPGGSIELGRVEVWAP